jgi:ribosomal-protein-alanine N-acetyltransferase
MTTVLDTPRMKLRAPRDQDAIAVAQLINNPAVSRNLTRVPHPYALDDARIWLAGLKRSQGRAHVFALTLDEAPIGVIGLEEHSPEPSAELGYWLGEPWWGNGYMSEAARAVLHYGFGTIELERVTSGYRHGNEASRRILSRLGFRHTGHARVHSLALKRMISIATVEVTRREWLRGGAE